MRTRQHPTLFEAEAARPDGFRYGPEFLERAEEAELLAHFAGLTFGEFRMRGVVARRRTVQFRWHYSFETFRLTPAEDPPEYLVDLQARAERFAGTPPGALDEILVTEYQPGATIGWHRDAPPFGLVVGVSVAEAALNQYICCQCRERESYSQRSWLSGQTYFTVEADGRLSSACGRSGSSIRRWSQFTQRRSPGCSGQ